MDVTDVSAGVFRRDDERCPDYLLRVAGAPDGARCELVKGHEGRHVVSVFAVWETKVYGHDLTANRELR